MVFHEYRLYDGRIIGGTDATELVQAMAETKFRAPRSAATYRRATARRISEAYRLKVDHSSNESFIAGLIEAELLSRVS